MHYFSRVSALCVALVFFAAACAPVAELAEEIAPELHDEMGERAEFDEVEENEAEPDLDVGEPAAAPVEGQLQVHFLDVGQADATLLLHADVTVLIDQGDWRRSDVVSYLRSFGVERIDLLITTHPHADHIGQFDQVMQHVQVDEVWWSGSIHTTRTFERAVEALEVSDAAYEEPRAGDSASIGPLVIEVVNPPSDANFDDIHDSNLALRISFGDVTFLFTGDAEAATEARTVQRHRAFLDVDILQLGHHGSSTSTTKAFLDAVNPSYAIYSAGAGNTFGHPHREVLDRLNTAGIPVYGTDVNGTITVTTDGTTFEVVAERDGTPVAGGDAGAAMDEPTPAAPTGGDGCQPGQIDINSASADQLTQIIHIGPERADQIVAMRPFSSVNALTRIDGIGAGRLNEILGEGLACVD